MRSEINDPNVNRDRVIASGPVTSFTFLWKVIGRALWEFVGEHAGAFYIRSLLVSDTSRRGPTKSVLLRHYAR